MVYDLAVYDLPIRAFLISTIRNGTEKFILAQEKHFNLYSPGNKFQKGLNILKVYQTE